MKKALHFINKQALLWCLFLIGQVAIGQMNTGPLPFSKTDNFDAYNPSTAANATSTLPSGWAVITPTSPAYNGRSTGSTANSNGFWSYGTTQDFSLGTICGNKVYGYLVNFKNTSSSTITSITLSWDYEQWRFVNAAGWDVTGTGQLASNTVLNSKDFTGSAIGTNGTVAVTSVSSFTLTGLSIANGQSFGLKWEAVDASGSDSGVSIDNFSITATAPPVAVPVVTGGTVNGTVGTALTNYQIVATNSPSSYALASGTLPAGLSISSTGLISGTPTTAGISAVTVTATNGIGTSDPATLNFDVAKGTQTITFGALASKEYGANFNLTATSTTSTPITYVSSNTSVATISGNTVTVVGVGSTIIKASQASTANYNAATDVDQSLSVTQKNLTISGLTGANKTYDASTTATASGTAILNGVLPADAANVLLSGTPTYNFASATVGIDKTITATGFALSGNASGNYSLTQPTALTATISAKEVTIAGAMAQEKVYDATTVAAINGGTLTGVETADVANITSTTGVFATANVGNGIAVTVTLTGSDASNYSLIQPGLTANITKASQTITFNALPTLNTGSGPINLNTFASTTSALALIYESSNTNVVSVSGNTLTVVGVGTAVITASQAGNSNYNAATNAMQGITVSLSPISIFSNPITGTNPNTSNPYTIGQTFNTNITVSGIGRGTGITGQDTTNRYNANGWNSTSLDLNDYFEFTLTPNAGYSIDFNNFQYTGQRSATGPTVFAFRSSLDGFTNNIGSPSVTGSTISLESTIYDVISASITFRIYCYNASAQGGTFSINDFDFTGNVSAATTWTITLPAITAAWTNGAPTASIDAIIDADYNETANITAKNLTINTGKVLTVNPTSTLKVEGNLTNDGSIVFKSDATGTASFASYTGAAIAGSGTSTVERYIPAKRAWRALTAPLQGSDASLYATWQNNGTVSTGTGVEIWGPAGTGMAVGPSYSALEYTSSGYVNVINTQTKNLFETNKNNAYLIFVTGGYGSGNIANTVPAESTTLKATGKLITGNVTRSDIIDARHTMIGNPYASPMSPASLLTNSTNLINKFWVWDSNLAGTGGYVMYDPTAGTYSNNAGSYTSSSTAIQSGQAFYVRAISGSTGSLTLTENNKSGTMTNAVFSNDTPEIFRISMYRQQSTDWLPVDGAIAAMYQSANPEVDVNDGRKFVNSFENIAFRKNNTSLSSEHILPPVAQDTLYFRVWNTTPNTYKLHLNTESFTTTGLIATLQDLYTNTNTVLNLDGSVNEYLFDVTTNVASANDRFRIVFSTDENLEISPNTKSPFVVAPNPVTNQLVTIYSQDDQFKNLKYMLVNALGQVVSKGNVNANKTINVANIAAGVYIMKLQTENNAVYTSKLIIK